MPDNVAYTNVLKSRIANNKTHIMIINKLERFSFGKYRNKSIQWILMNDPEYVIWTYQNVKTINYSDTILLEAIKNSKKCKL